MSERQLNIDEPQFDAALVELSERPDLFDTPSRKNHPRQFLTEYLALDCLSVSRGQIHPPGIRATFRRIDALPYSSRRTQNVPSAARTAPIHQADMRRPLSAGT